MHNVLTHVVKSCSVGAGAKRCVVLQASTLVCNFYLLRMFVTGSNEVQAFEASQLGHFYFNKVQNTHVCSSRGCCKVLPPWSCDSLL